MHKNLFQNVYGCTADPHYYCAPAYTHGHSGCNYTYSHYCSNYNYISSGCCTYEQDDDDTVLYVVLPMLAVMIFCCIGVVIGLCRRKRKEQERLARGAERPGVNAVNVSEE